jgi:hypothetical protein
MNNKLCSTLLAVTVGMGLSFAAHASNVTAGVQKIIIVEGQNMAYIYPAKAIAKIPCHTHIGNAYALDMERPRAREYLAMLLTAYGKGGNVQLVGTATCNDIPNMESLNYLGVL